VRNYILTNLRKTEITNGEQQKYLDEFFEKNIKVVEVDKDFIKKYSE